MKKLIENKWIVLGEIGGYFYWKDVGCASGKCIIQSNWQVMMPYGMLMGYFIFDSVQSIARKLYTKKD